MFFRSSDNLTIQKSVLTSKNEVSTLFLGDNGNKETVGECPTLRLHP